MKASTDKLANANVKKCTFCATPESETRKHKVCSACKQAFYCCADCQKYDWQKTHKAICKELQAKARGENNNSNTSATKK